MTPSNAFQLSNPEGLYDPSGNAYSHVAEVRADSRLLFIAGQGGEDSNGQLLATLRSWCEHDGQSQACADALGIHRNSLRYRLERIAELGEVDPLRMEGMLSLYLALQLLPAA